MGGWLLLLHDAALALIVYMLVRNEMEHRMEGKGRDHNGGDGQRADIHPQR